jgi:hypothetical protein
MSISQNTTVVRIILSIMLACCIVSRASCFGGSWSMRGIEDVRCWRDSTFCGIEASTSARYDIAEHYQYVSPVFSVAHSLFDRVAPSSLFRYSPRSVTRVISFSCPSFSPTRNQHASPPPCPAKLTRRALLRSLGRLLLIPVIVQQVLLNI